MKKVVHYTFSRQFFNKYPSNRFKFRKLWGRGYRAEEIRDQSHLKRVVTYIKGQRLDGIDKKIILNCKPQRRIGSRDV